MVIHQYTSIDSLALILKNKTIKFNRLDCMDDIEEEALSHLGVRLGGFMFASCWTYSEEESIPLWKMYTPSSRGVRISLNKDMFAKYPFSLNGANEDIIMSAIPYDKMFTREYTIINTFWNESFFFNKIQYVDDIRAKYDSLIQEKEESVNISWGNVGSFKHNSWSFQDECRFRLQIFPNDGIFISEEQYASYLIHCIEKERYPSITSYFLNLKEGIFDNLTITLSPFSTEADRILINLLCNEYAPNATIKESSLRNKIRLK